MQSFKKSLYAKCILSGEHAVLRGAPALVFPLKKYAIEVDYKSSDEYFECQFHGPYGSSLKFLFWGLLEESLKRVGKKRSDLFGSLELTSYLPLSGGLGASAAICVGVGHFLSKMGFVSNEELFEFCRSLEDQFHGESSGVDIAISFYESSIIYRREQKPQAFQSRWKPKIYLFYSGKKGVTSECVNKVKALKLTNPSSFSILDNQMKTSVESCIAALSEPESTQTFLDLCEGLKLAQECFEKWGLVPDPVKSAIRKLEEGGAAQCKLTGSGGGGYILSLWKNEPPAELKEEMVELLF